MKIKFPAVKMVRMILMGCVAVMSLPTAGQSVMGLGEKDRAEAREIFQQLIEINTTDSVGNVTTAAEAMAKRLRDAGFASEDVQVLGPTERKKNMVARYRGRAGSGLKPILLIGHLDVVEAKREDWTTDPFQFVEKDGYFYGRGTQDMKDEDAAMMEAFLRMKRAGYVPDRDIILALTADEEFGNQNGVEWLVKNHRELVDAEFVLNPDSGGVDSDHGKPVEMSVGATEKLYADFALTAMNAGGHSSRPSPDNAIYHVADALGRIEKYKFPFELNEVTRAYFAKMQTLVPKAQGDAMRGVLETPPQKKAIDELSKDNWYNAVMHTTCVATMIQGGHALNALPQMARANVNCRILPGHTPAEVRAELTKIVNDPKVTIQLVDNGGQPSNANENKMALPPPPLSPTLFGALEATVQQMWPGLPIVPDMMTGASDSKYTAQAGMPSYGVGGTAVDITDDRAHGKDERLPVESYYKGVEFYTLLLQQLTK